MGRGWRRKSLCSVPDVVLKTFFCGDVSWALLLELPKQAAYSSLSACVLRQTICYLQPYWEMQISSTTGTFSYWHKIKRWTMSILSNHFPILYPLHSKKGLFIIECWFSLDSKKTTRLFNINGYQIWSCFVR